ncbi:MAG TPA: hypothetical protein VHC67_16615 [Gaiellaceae bacterium]|nr:hypothetical protein [Gaiellaceae bacterium]
MYDTLRTSYTFACPVHGETHVRLSRFRRLEELPGAHHPAVYRVDFDCGCGGEHPGLVTHDDLDWAPLGLEDGTAFMNLMTSKVETIGGELGELAATRIKAGEWPWSFFCWPEERPRPVTPSAFRLLAPVASDDLVGVAVRCPVCGKVSVNVVSREHVDVPFVNDRQIGVVRHLFEDDVAATVEEFRAELWSAAFDARRLGLE